MRLMKTFNLALMTVACVATCCSGQITFFEPTDDNPEPFENIVYDQVFEDGGISGTIIDATMPQGARGHNFVIGNPGDMVEIGGLTFEKNAEQTFTAGQEMTVLIFSGDDFTGVDVNDISPAGLLAAPGINMVYEETFDLDGITAPPRNFLLIQFANTITVDAGDTLGVMVFTNFAFTMIEGSNNGGGRLLFRAGDEVSGPSGSRDFRFSLLGPPPAGGPCADPSVFTQFRGLAVGAPATSDFAGPDGVVASYNPGFTISNTEAPVWLIFDYAAAAAGGVDVTSFAGTPGLTMTVEYSIDGGANYVEIGTAGESFNTASTETFSLGGVSTDKIRVGWRRTGFTINFPWEVNIDAVNLCE